MSTCNNLGNLFLNPHKNPKNFWISSCVISTIISAISFAVIVNQTVSSEDSSSKLDATILLDREYDTFSSTPITHSFTLHTKSHPNTYGAMVYTENNGFDVYQITLYYKFPNETTTVNCGRANPGGNFPAQFSCDIHPLFFPDATIFTIELQKCQANYGSCSSITSFAYLSVLPLSTSTKYEIQTSFDENNIFAIGISRYHYFRLNANKVNSFKLSLKDTDSWYGDNCDELIQYDRCIYVSDESNAQHKSTCNYKCHNDDDGSYYLETLSVTNNNHEIIYLINIYIDMSGVDSTDLDVYGTKLELFVEEDLWFYGWTVFGGCVGFIFCAMLPATRFYYQGVGKLKYQSWKLNRKKNRFIKRWNRFNLERYKMLMKVVGEKGVVDVIQSYMDDLECLIQIRDDTIFTQWYFSKYKYEQQAHNVQLQKPLLVNATLSFDTGRKGRTYF
eukprot:453742_1